MFALLESDWLKRMIDQVTEHNEEVYRQGTTVHIKPAVIDIQ